MKWTNVYGLDQLGSFLQKTRKEKGYTQDEFAEIIGASHATLSALEMARASAPRPHACHQRFGLEAGGAPQGQDLRSCRRYAV